MKTLLTAAALSAAIASGPVAASSGSYSGNWPIIVTKSLFMNGSYCLTVTDDGSQGWTHSGEATIPGYGGVFQVIHGKFIADIVEPAGEQNDTMLFTSAGHNGTFGDGGVQLIAGGEPLDSGMMTVGQRGGC